MSSKRIAGEQITRESLEDFDNRNDSDDEAPQGPSKASAEVLATRKIKMPRSRLNRTSANPSKVSSSAFGADSQTNGDKPRSPFAGFGASTPASKTHNPFGQLSAATSTHNNTSTPSFNFAAPKIPSTTTEEDVPKANPFGFLKSSASVATTNQPAIASLFSSSNKTSDSNKIETTQSKSLKPTKMQSLNDSLYAKITEQRSKNPIGDLTPILKKYIEYIQQIEKDDKQTPISTKPTPQSTSITEPVKQSFNFGQTSKPIFSSNPPNSDEKISQPVPASAQVNEIIDIDSDDSDDSIKVEGPTFSLTKPPTTTDSVFTLSKDFKPTNSFGTGPSFTFTATGKKSDSVFKLKDTSKPAAEESKKQDNEKETKEVLVSSKPAFGASTVSTEPESSFNSLTSGTTSAAPAFTLNSKSIGDKKEEPKPLFGFGAKSSENEPVSSKPAFSFGASASTDKPSFKFGTSTVPTNEKPINTFNFGSTSSSTSTSSEKPGFSFGAIPAATSANENPATSFNFGATSKSSVSNGFGGFGSTTASTAETTKPVFSFGSSSTTTPSLGFGGAASTPTSTFNFTLGATKPAELSSSTATAPGTIVGDAESSELEKEADVHFKPVVELKDKVEEKTGEEDEVALYTKKSKLMLFQPSNKENPYDSKGLGELKVLKNNATGRARVLVRAEGSNRVVINASVNKEFKYDFLTAEKKNMVKIPSISAEGKIETYIARVKTAEDGQSLLDALNKAKED